MGTANRQIPTWILPMAINGVREPPLRTIHWYAKKVRTKLKTFLKNSMHVNASTAI